MAVGGPIMRGAPMMARGGARGTVMRGPPRGLP